jgi:dTDP-4-amino-4,6-dideoxygalactose transaminase
MPAKKNIPYGRQSISEEDIQSVVKALRSDWLTQGPQIAEFKEAFVAYGGAKYFYLN